MLAKASPASRCVDCNREHRGDCDVCGPCLQLEREYESIRKHVRDTGDALYDVEIATVREFEAMHGHRCAGVVECWCGGVA